MVDGIKEFNVTEKQALHFANRFKDLRNGKNDYEVMQFLFDESLDDEKVYNLLLLNAWKSLMDVSEIAKKLK